jgi:hypothetical protein
MNTSPWRTLVVLAAVALLTLRASSVGAEPPSSLRSDSSKAGAGTSGAAQTDRQNETPAVSSHRKNQSQENAGSDGAARAFRRASQAYRARDWQTAARGFARAAVLAPHDGEAWLMAGLASQRAGLPRRARFCYQAALARPLTADDRALAQAGVAELSTSSDNSQSQEVAAIETPAASPSSLWWSMFIAAAGGGWDSNVGLATRTGVDELDRGDDFKDAGAAFIGASLITGGGRWFGKVVSAQAVYSLFQTIFTDRRFENWSGQDHTLEAMLQFSLSESWKLALAPRANLTFLGVRDSFTGFMAIGGGEAELAYVPVRWWRSTASVYLGKKEALAPDFEPLGGARAEAAFGQIFKAAGFTAAASFTLRDEDVGARRDEAGTLPANDACAGCTVDFVSAYSYRATIAAVRFSSRADRPVRLVARGRLEDRPYQDENRLETRLGNGRRDSWQSWRRHDHRLGAGADLFLRLGKTLEIGLRYDLVIHRSNIDGREAGDCLDSPRPCHPLWYQNRNFSKHVVGLELVGSWF